MTTNFCFNIKPINYDTIREELRVPDDAIVAVHFHAQAINVYPYYGEV